MPWKTDPLKPLPARESRSSGAGQGLVTERLPRAAVLLRQALHARGLYLAQEGGDLGDVALDLLILGLVSWVFAEGAEDPELLHLAGQGEELLY
ncbi:unnamed protein product [Clonostachys rosea f. rosea IK726]|uniref:Uncharacterized protein n=1 Tax=Clonostachys rosea f. rosea IK726 TaxID=1349383 RepID=A0ACA9TTU9_BIOOC|nr:unnamed protein product [Clonostachys rosea f. rosea IK726]